MNLPDPPIRPGTPLPPPGAPPTTAQATSPAPTPKPKRWPVVAAGAVAVVGLAVIALGMRDPGPQRLSGGADDTATSLAEPAVTATIPGVGTATTVPSASTATTTAPTTAPSTIAPTTVAPATTVATTVAPTTAPPTTAAVALTNQCSSTSYGWDISYPADWYTAGADAGSWECAVFDEAPVELVEGSEVDGSVLVLFHEVDSATVRADVTVAAEVLSEGAVMVGQYPALRLELRATGEGFWPEGTLLVEYLVDRGGWSTVQIEGIAADDAALEELATIVDAMAATMTFWDG